MLRMISLGAGFVGMAFLLIALIGRFSGTPRVDIFGHTMESGTFLVLANTALLIGIFLHLVVGKGKS